MALSPGTRFGRYEIRAAIGAGGMGAVYRAHDTTLKRDVALKVVLDEFASDADRRRRFEREALATAALNHPNILAVYDVGTHDDTTYVVSELLEGKTLREALTTGPLPPRRAARYAAQIADGLAAAHDKGIIHRDIKPANLFVTSDDRVKILDFGLARVGNPSSHDEGAAASTATGLTTPGLVLGSAGYMAPEQVRGAAVDHRADIFSLGVVLYEMLAGRRAFHRDTVAGTLAAIVEADPPSSSGDGSAASHRLMRLVRRCLEKTPAQRFQSARDLALVLADESGDEQVDATASGSPRFRWRSIATTALVTAAVIAGFALLVWPGLARDTAPPAQGPVEFEVTAPDGSDRLGNPVLSNDGRTLAFRAGGGGGSIYIRDIAGRTARLLEGTAGATYYFFSPDGRRIAFFADQQLKIASIDAGAPFVVCPTKNSRGGTWTDDDTIVFAEVDKGLSQVSPSAGATPTPLTSLNPGEKGHRAPHALPGGAGIVFTVWDGLGYSIEAVKKGGDRHVVQKRGSTPKYGAGHLFFVSENDELASAPFDIRTLKVTGPVVVHPERPTTSFNLGSFAYTVARDGTLAYKPWVPNQRQLAIVGQDRIEEPLGKPGSYVGPRASPDGKSIAVVTIPRPDWGDVLIGDLQGSFQPLTTDGVSRHPVWDSTGTRVAVESRRDGGAAIWIHEVGTRNAEKGIGPNAAPVALLPDGGILLDRYEIPNKPSDELYLLRPGAQTAEPLPLGVTQEAFGRISADSSWLAYTNADSRQYEAYVTAYPPRGQRPWQVSQAGSGRGVVWAKSGNVLYFQRNDGEVMVVTIGPSGPTGGPRSAGVGKFPLGSPGSPQYDTLPDGRFVVSMDVADSSPTQPIVVVLNRVPAAPR